MEFIESQVQLYPDLVEQHMVLGESYEKKLWHQLTIFLQNFLKNQQNIRGNNFLDLYNQFIYPIEARLDQVQLALLLSLVGSSLPNDEESLEFYLKVLLSRARLGQEASLCIDMETVMIKMKLGKYEEAKMKLDEAKELLPSIKSTESVVFSKFYQATTEYRKHVGPSEEFYSASLMYLAYTPIEDLTSTEKYTLATDIALASITGENIFNFGEVIATPILSSLENTPNQWLRDLVYHLHHGDIDNFNLIVDENHEAFYSQPSLSNLHEQVKQKLVLLCVLNIAFERASNDRVVKFSDISERARISIDQVEWVLMRAMSLQLIKGVIDQVDEVVQITWIIPRVLEKQQLSLLNNQIQHWSEKVKEAMITLEDQTPELLG